MKELKSSIESAANKAIKDLYQADYECELQQTRKEFSGDFTVVVFPLLRISKKGPEETARDIGERLLEEVSEIKDYNIVKGFLNLEITGSYWQEQLYHIAGVEAYGTNQGGDEAPMMVEYSSPNTNKPLHLGHIRNNLLGSSVAELYKAIGSEVYKVQIINDRGIHICKSMVAWQEFGKGETPESSGMKGDHLVGKYYVEFEKELRRQVKRMVEKGEAEERAREKAPIFQQARETLKLWESGDKEVVELWKTMNSWVYSGFDETYRRLGVEFDRNYYESETYLLGRRIVEQGVEDGIFYRREDGSVWVDLTSDGLDEKLLLRSDGTSVYMTQDIGTAIQRFNDFGIEGMVYTVGNEQDYHFKVLFLILKKLGYEWADRLYHLSYGMVDLPGGRMKSREGTVVDADDLMDEVIKTAKKISEEQGKTEGLSEEEKEKLYETVGLGALKYYILKVDPRKKMIFNPEESVDFQGNTGPFIQYTHARIKSLLRKAGDRKVVERKYTDLKPVEQEVIKWLLKYPEMVNEAALQHSPAVIANYCYELVKSYNAFYQQLAVLTDPDEAAVDFRLTMSVQTARVIKSSMALLGIEVPEKM